MRDEGMQRKEKITRTTTSDDDDEMNLKGKNFFEKKERSLPRVPEEAKPDRGGSDS